PPGVSDDNWQFAYQGIAGVKWQVVPAVSVSLDYRYFATTDFNFSAHGQAFSGTALSSVKGEYHSHNVMLGIAFHFLPPPPPPPPPAPAPAPAAAPAPAPAQPQRVFIVFFDFDQSDLTPEGAKVVKDAADTFKSTGSVRIKVDGYTDLS